MTTNQRTENPHRPSEAKPLLPAHPLRPATFASGIALTGLGGFFLAQQLGAITTGPAATGAAVIIALAVTLVGVALGWTGKSPSDAEVPGKLPSV